MKTPQDRYLSEASGVNEESEGLENYLRHLREPGATSEQGEFSVNLTKAQEKLSAHQLENQSFWVLKMVQAAVAGDADDIAITFRRKTVRVAFQNAQNWTADHVMNLVLSGLSAKERSLGHLVTGLRASFAHSCVSLCLRCGGQKATLTAEGYELVTFPEDSQVILEVVRPSRAGALTYIRNSDTVPIAHLVRKTLEEYLVLTERCRTCPIPLFLDGRELERGYGELRARGDWTEAAIEDLRRVPVSCWTCLGVHPVVELGRNAHLTYPVTAIEHDEEGEYATGKCVAGFGPLLRFLTSSRKVQAVVALWSGALSHTLVDFILDGVILETQKYPNPVPILQGTFLGHRVAVGVESSDVDLSQFKVKDRLSEEQLQRIYEAAVVIGERALDHLSLIRLGKSNLAGHQE